ncbi:MAG: glycosyltransferase family 9 protein [Limisphaerales bacterium]
MSAPENILLIRLKSIGDIVLALPAVHVVRQNYPDARLHFLVSKEFAPLLRGFSEIDEIIPFDRAAFHSQRLPAIGFQILHLIRRLRQMRFSLVVDFQGYGETAWLSWLSGAPERWGSVYGPGREWLYTRGVRRDDSLHLADWNLSLLQQCGLKAGGIQNEFVLPEDATIEARKIFAANNLDTARPILFVQPFTSSPQKDWPLENYLRLAADWRARGAQILFVGGPADQTSLEPARLAGYCVAAGQSLLASAGLLKLSTVTIGGVTGLLHLAVAMQKRVVMLVGPAHEPGFPYQHLNWGLTPETGDHVSNITVPAVIAACAEAFNESAGNAL